jgi:hypothetical protein
MKIIVTHTSPDWDAITSVWLIKKYLAGWQEAAVRFVPAGESIRGNKVMKQLELDAMNPIEQIGDDEVMHVDTGLGPLDHHQTSDDQVCGASRTWDYVRVELEKSGQPLTVEHTEAVSRVVKVVVAIDHFKEVFWPDAAADYQEFSLYGVLEGLKFEKPNQDDWYFEFGVQCLNAVVANFENRIWAEKEIRETGVVFETRFGKGIGFETLNDTVLKLSQKMGYVIVLRKDPRKQYIRIKALPAHDDVPGADLTLAYEQLKKIDPDATWFLHVSKKMLLNGSPKNPKMRATKLSLHDIIKVLEKI